jgi:hypothetical protein
MQRVLIDELRAAYDAASCQSALLVENRERSFPEILVNRSIVPGETLAAIRQGDGGQAAFAKAAAGQAKLYTEARPFRTQPEGTSAASHPNLRVRS